MNRRTWNPPAGEKAGHCGRRLVVLGLIFLGVLLAAGPAQATPTIPVLLVNHETRSCAEAILGDDCSWCDPLPGWEVLGDAGSVECPAGYRPVDRPDLDCRRYKNQFCCSGGAHRGDCEDLVVYDIQERCAFVASIASCTLPEGWAARPADVRPMEWACPMGYTWQSEELACLVPRPRLQPTAAPSEPPAAPNATTPSSPWRSIVISLVCLIFAGVLFSIAAIFPVWYVNRRREREQSE